MSDSELQVFISSIMKTDALRAERKAAVEAVKRYPGLRPWHWESCGYAASCPPMEICLEAVRNSDVLILLLGSDLSENTRKEHQTAVRLKIPDFIFVRHGRLNKETRAYLERHRKRVTYMEFESVKDLEAMIARSLWEEIVHGYRKGRSARIGTRASYARSSTGGRNG